jgi:hypothetical protein
LTGYTVAATHRVATTHTGRGSETGAGPLLAPKEFGSVRKGLPSGKRRKAMYTAGADLDAGSVAGTKSVEAGARGAGACRRLSGAEGRNATALPPVRSWWSNVEDDVDVEVDRKRVALFKRLENTAFPAVSRRCTSSLVSSSRLICPRRRDIPLLRVRRSAMPRGMLARPWVHDDERGGGAGRRPVNTVVRGGVAGRGRNGAPRVSCSPREGS